MARTYNAATQIFIFPHMVLQKFFIHFYSIKLEKILHLNFHIRTSTHIGHFTTIEQIAHPLTDQSTQTRLTPLSNNQKKKYNQYLLKKIQKRLVLHQTDHLEVPNSYTSKHTTKIALFILNPAERNWRIILERPILFISCSHGFSLELFVFTLV